MNIKDDNKIDNNEENLFENSNERYTDKIYKIIKSNEYKDEGEIQIEQNGEKITTHAYSLTLSKNEFLKFYSEITEMIVNDEKIINSIVTKNESDNENDEIQTFESNLDYNNTVVTEKSEIYSLRDKESLTQLGDNDLSNFSDDSLESSVIKSKLEDFAKKLNDGFEKFNDYQILYKGIKYAGLIFTDLGINCDEEKVEEDLNEIFENINNKINDKLPNDGEVKIVVYGENNQTRKVSILLGENVEITIDYLPVIQNKYMTNITISEKNGDFYNGYIIKFNKNKTTVIDNNSIELNIVSESQIVNKLEIKLNIEGSSNSNKFKNNLNLLFSGSEGKFTCNISNELDFDKGNAEKISMDNTLLIDSLDTKKFYQLMNQLNFRADKVYEDKVSKLNLINTNTADNTLKSSENQVVEEVNEDEKNALIDLLVNTISTEMGNAQNSGKNYTIKDLKNLAIDGYEIQVSVSNEIAIIKINNYTFKVDKDFNLSE